MKALNREGKEIEIKTISDKRLFFHNGNCIEDLSAFKCSVEDANDLEKAKDKLYDLPYFDGECIFAKHGKWEVKQIAEEITTEMRYYIIDNEGNAHGKSNDRAKLENYLADAFSAEDRERLELEIIEAEG